MEDNGLSKSVQKRLAHQRFASSMPATDLRFHVRFLSGQTVVAEIPGIRPIDSATLTVGDMQDVVATEQLLEKLTGLRVHIEQVS